MLLRDGGRTTFGWAVLACLLFIIDPIFDRSVTAKRKLERLQVSTSSSFSKFEVPVVVNLKHIFELFGLYTHLLFDLETIGVN